ncbi:hypothetical protein [Amycolatopsis sp. DSM 110486]|uniref:hypothetical protein n=1 Tax=Amycolatopsis sp. DSM 110486 TaxID=2865832 RepID=UPI001C69FF6A|nr:hypothetical protein [Amycolatopsis sp. DSM 110486]QYN25556.1 hypothetical protein K1T34_25920 [Amycolatopsis sp. DSM 110486]
MMPRNSFLATWVLWTVGFLAFPLGGVAGGVVVGRVDSPLAALFGGAVTGLVVGTGQALVSRRRLDPLRWIPATTVGMGAGLFIGAAAVDYGTSPADLAIMGAFTGVLLGAAQLAALPPAARHRWAWVVAMPVLWCLGWVITTSAGIKVDEQFTIFGSAGAVTVSALSGLLLHWLLPYWPAVPVSRKKVR